MMRTKNQTLLSRHGLLVSRWALLLLIGVGVVCVDSRSVAMADESVTQLKLIKAGRAKAQACTRCHGRRGMAKMARRADWTASLAAFVTRELVAFRDKQRSHTIMNAVAATLSDNDIHQIALWYESVSPRQSP